MFGSFFSKVGEKLADYALNTARSIKDFKFILDSLQRNLRSLSAKASDVEEQIKNAEQSGRKKRKREVQDWLTEVNAIETEFLQLENEIESQGFISMFIGGGRATQLNERVNDLVKQSRHFGELLLEVCETRGEALLTTRLVGKASEENLERIWRLLVTEKVLNLGIYGMGGVGKTTLAKRINNLLIERSEECVIWVTVSQEFTIEKLQDEIARVVGVGLSDEVNEDKRAARLHRRLSLRKNNTLILDDVWKNINLEKVGYPLSVEGCRLIITTRSSEVCRQLRCQEVIWVQKLPTDEAWDLFNETLGNETKLPPQVEDVAKHMTKLCDGLPLGIITLAGSMRGETDIHVWRNALEELQEFSVLGPDDMEDEVFKVLKYSFDRLNPNNKRQRQSNGYNSLQLCFLYCSLYPEDFEIEKEELVRKFISEELMDKRKSRNAQVDQGYSILNRLVNVCLLENPQYGCVKMHDLVRAMALKITEGKTMVVAGHFSLTEIPNEEDWTKDIEKMSLMKNGIKEIPPEMSPNSPKLTTLLLQGNILLKVFPDLFFSRMHGLCTLDLSQTKIKELPNSLSDLKSLKALLLEGCLELEFVPNLGKLKALKELDLTRTAISEVPPGIEELVNLKFLSINVGRLGMFPSGLLLRFPNLQFLKFPHHIDVPIEEIERLQQREEFVGRVKNVCDFNRFIRGGRSRVYDTLYNIQIGLGFDYEGILGGYKKVKLLKYNLQKREEKDETLLGHDIEHLVISECEGLSNCLLDDFPRLISNPRSLKTLEISNCEGIECILKGEQLMMMMAPQELQSQLFSTLVQVELWGLRDFKGITIHQEEREIGGGTAVVPSAPSRQALFSSLRELFIAYCDKIKKLELPVFEFPILEYMYVGNCDEIEEIIEVGNDNGDRRGEGQAKLKWLTLFNLPRLKSICNNKATMISTSIERISLKGCPTLNKLPLDVVPPPALEQICIAEEEREWWESLEWEHPTHPLLLQPFLSFVING